MLVFTIFKRNIYNTYIPTYLGFSYKKIIQPQKPIQSTVYKILKEKKDDKKDTKKNMKQEIFKFE